MSQNCRIVQIRRALRRSLVQSPAQTRVTEVVEVFVQPGLEHLWGWRPQIVWQLHHYLTIFMEKIILLCGLNLSCFKLFSLDHHAWLHLLAYLPIGTGGLLLSDPKAISSLGWTSSISLASAGRASAATPDQLEGLRPSAELVLDYQCLSCPKPDTEVYAWSML